MEALRQRLLYLCSTDGQRRRLLSVMRRRASSLRRGRFLEVLVLLADEEQELMVEQGESIGEGGL